LEEQIISVIKNIVPYPFEDLCILYISPKGYVRRTKADAWKKRKCVIEYYAYKDLLRNSIEGKYIANEVLKVVFLLQVPQSLSNKKKNELYYTPHKKKPDIDNLVKALLDTFHKQDNIVHTIYAHKIYAPFNAIVLLT
jgi:Holliday junction resolvase RusA-like endonuclease